MVPFPKLTIHKTMIQHTTAASQSTDYSSVAELLTSLQPSEKNRYVCKSLFPTSANGLIYKKIYIVVHVLCKEAE
jgi:hypothetical protein